MHGKTALVTGGSRGIGCAIALALAEAGAYVALTYHTREQAAENVVRAIHCAGGQAEALRLPLQNHAAIAGVLRHMTQRHGGVDILVNNAAMSQEKPFLTLTVEDYVQMWAVNLQGPLLCCQGVLPHMLQQRWGRIVNIASIGGQIGGRLQVHYAAAKSGVISLTRSLARLYSGEGITVNAVSPGLIATEMVEAELASPEGQVKVSTIPAGRIGTVDEVAAVVAFLVSDEARYVTGQCLNVNGGQYCG